MSTERAQIIYEMRRLRDQPEIRDRMLAALANPAKGWRKRLRAVLLSIREKDRPTAWGRWGKVLTNADLLKILVDPTETVSNRSDAAQNLGHRGCRRALPDIIAAARQRELSWLQSGAVLALGCYEYPPAMRKCVPALIELLTSEQDSDFVRSCAAGSLGDLKSKKAVPYLVSALKDKDPEVRYYSAWGLGSICDLRALEPLRVALEEESNEDFKQGHNTIKMEIAAAIELLTHRKTHRRKYGLSH